MARRKDNNVLGLAPPSSDFGSVGTEIVPWGSRWEMSKEDERINQEAQLHRRAIEIIESKVRLGTFKIGEIHQHAMQTFEETTSFIVEIKDQAGRSQQHQAYIDQYSERHIQLLAQHLMGITDVGATAVGKEVYRSPYPPPEPEPKPIPPPPRRGLLGWLIGDRP
jgi:hypothetical protein